MTSIDRGHNVITVGATDDKNNSLDGPGGSPKEPKLVGRSRTVKDNYLSLLSFVITALIALLTGTLTSCAPDTSKAVTPLTARVAVTSVPTIEATSIPPITETTPSVIRKGTPFERIGEENAYTTMPN